MTPFGLFVRQKRAVKNIALKDMARAIGLTPSYLSALELGKKGRPSVVLIQKIAQYLFLNPEELALLYEAACQSDKRIVIPDNVGPNVYRFVHDIMNTVTSLSTNDIEVIQCRAID